MSDALRICLITGEYPPDEGGVADYTRCLADALAERGVAVDVVTSRRHPGGDDRLPVESTGGDRERVQPGSDHRVQVWPGGDHRVQGQPGDNYRVRVHRVVPDWGWTSHFDLRRTISKLEPDVIHVQYQTAAFDMHPAINFGLGLLGRKSGGRRESALTAITYHDLREPYLFPKAGPVRGWVTRLPARRADLTVTTNEADHEALAAWGHARRLALVPIGANVPDAPPDGWTREAWRESAGVPRDADLLVYFGFLNPSKGGRTLLAALGRLVAQGRDARLVMLGGTVGASDATNAAELAAFKSEVEAAGLAERIMWTGHVPPAEVSGWLRAADVAVLPYADGASYRRGSLLAALEHGCAVVTTWPEGVVREGAVTTATGSAEQVVATSTTLRDRDEDQTDVIAPHASDVPLARLRPVADSSAPPLPSTLPPAHPTPLRDRESARLVRPGDPEALAVAIVEVLDDTALAARLRSGAKELSAQFGWDAIAERHETLFRSIVGRG